MRHLVPLLLLAPLTFADDPKPILIAKPDAFQTLVNPNCSHCVDEAKRRKDELKDSDPVLCWTRGYSDGGAIPLRFFLNTYRVISDSYGTFVYDPDAGYARGFAPSYNFVFHGWRNGVMVMRDKTDDTLYSCLSGVAFDGPRKGDRLKPVPTIVTTWGEVMKRNPNAVAYHMFEKYKPIDLPTKANEESVKTRPDKVADLGEKELGNWADRPEKDAFQRQVLVIRFGGETKAVTLGTPQERMIPNAHELAKVMQEKPFLLRSVKAGGVEVVAIWDGGNLASAYLPIASQPRKWKGPNPDKNGVSPPDAGTLLPGDKEWPPVVVTLIEKDGIITDKTTGSKWGIDGRAYEGQLKGWTLQPVDDSVVCKYFAYLADYREAFKKDPTPQPPPRTEEGEKDKANPDRKGGGDEKVDPNKKVRQVAGSAEFLRLLPKPFGVIKAIDPKARTVSLLLDGEKTAKVWSVEPDAEIKVNGFWGRLDQFKVNDRVWVWLKLDRTKNPTSVAMIADEVSTQDIHHEPDNKKAPPVKFTPEQVEAKRSAQRDHLRKQWAEFGLPGVIAFHHPFSGEMDVTLDHEAMRWGRSLKYGDGVELTADPPIKGVVKSVTPWRERTQVRLVVGELQSSELRSGQRIGLKMPAPPKEVDESPYPPDIGRKRSDDERVEWFLCSIYCVCGVGNDICTGHFYTLASCNPNGCGAPNATRDEIRDLIAKGKSDREIWDSLLKDRGPLMLRPHLKP